MNTTDGPKNYDLPHSPKLTPKTDGLSLFSNTNSSSTSVHSTISAQSPMIASDEYFPNLTPVQSQQGEQQYLDYNPGNLDVTQQQFPSMNDMMEPQLDYTYLVKPQYPYPSNQEMLPLNDNFAQTLAPADSLLKKNKTTPWEYLNTNFYSSRSDDPGLDFFINEQQQQFVPYTNEIDFSYDAAPEVEDDDDDEMCDEFDDLHEYMENEDMDLDIDLDQFEVPPLEYDTPTVLHPNQITYQQPILNQQQLQNIETPVYQEPVVDQEQTPTPTESSPHNSAIPNLSTLSLDDTLYESNPSSTSLNKDSDYMFEPSSSSSTTSSPGFENNSVSTVEPVTRTRRRKPTSNNTEGRVHVCKHIDANGNPCGKVFSRPYDLIRHKDTIHAAVRKTYKCEHCGDDSKTFSRMDALSRHIRVKHSKESKG